MGAGENAEEPSTFAMHSLCGSAIADEGWIVLTGGETVVLWTL